MSKDKCLGIFLKPNEGDCVGYPSNVLETHNFGNWRISHGYSPCDVMSCDAFRPIECEQKN